MEDHDVKQTGSYEDGFIRPRTNRSGRVMGGLLLVVVGVLLLAAKMNAIHLPSWIFSWQMFLIVLGLFLGFKHSFQKPGALILVLIGFVFLIDNYFFFNIRVYFWPLLVISLGLWLILKPKRDFSNSNRGFQQSARPVVEGEPAEPYYTGSASVEDVVDATAIFGGIKKNIISKKFRGGEVVSVFGGTELNLSQADMEYPVVLEATQIFGGTTLIVPPHWQVKSEMVAILGGIEDKRPVMIHGYDPNKILILRGTTLFGGLNIKSY